MLTRNELFERMRMGYCLYLYEDELPALAALAGQLPPPPPPTVTINTNTLRFRETSTIRDDDPVLPIRIIPRKLPAPPPA